MNALSWFSHVRLSLAGGAVILLTGMVLVGAWVEGEIRRVVINRAGMLASLYVDSFVSPHLQRLAGGRDLREVDRAVLDALLSGTPLGKQIMLIKVWASDGRVIYSSDPALTGSQFPVKPALATAFAGEVHSSISDLHDAENASERRRWSSLMETYAPLRADNTGEIVAVVEFYHSTEDLARELRAAGLRSWLFVGVVTPVMLLMLAALVKRASDTIVAQRVALGEKVSQLAALLDQNEKLHERVQRAATRTTSLNERFLGKIASDLHDGPGQGVALTLMRMEALAEVCGDCVASVGKERSVGQEFCTLLTALRAALDDLRAISKGLHLPEIEQLSLVETVERAIRDYEGKAGRSVSLDVGDVPDDVPMVVKISLFRVLQESLANGFRHSGGGDQQVHLTRSEGQIVVEIADQGHGFDTGSEIAAGHLGLTGMRERIELLGGRFSVESHLGRGTVIRAAVPEAPGEAEHG